MIVFAIILEVIIICLLSYVIWLFGADDIKCNIRKAKSFCKAVKIGVCKKVLEKEGVVIPKESDK